MNKKIIAAAIAAAIVAPAAAMAGDVTVYGKIRQSYDAVDSKTANTDRYMINDHASRLGFKGSEDLGDGLKAIFKMEFGVNISTNNAGNEFSPASPVTSGRNAIVGLAGDFGTMFIGRHDTPLKISTGRLDYFADTAADYNGGQGSGMSGVLNGIGADRRADGTLAYISPSFSGLTIAAAIIPGENTGAAAANNLVDAYSVTAMYSNGPIYASIAHEHGENNITALGTANDLDQTRFGLEYKMDAIKVGVVYQTVDNLAVGAADEDAWVIAGAYTMGNNVIKAKYYDVQNDGGVRNSDYDGWAIGLDHNFSKRTQAYVVYASEDQNTTNGNTDPDVFSVGLNHSF